MSTLEAPERPHDDVGEHDDEHHDHPTDKKYVKIAVILAVLTAAEIATYPGEDLLGSFLIPILLVLMVIKFWYVAAFFMHLKFDARMFSWVFIAGLATAAIVYIIVLATFEFFV